MTDARNHHIGLRAWAAHGFSPGLKLRGDMRCAPVKLEDSEAFRIVGQRGKAALEVLSPATISQSRDAERDLHDSHGRGCEGFRALSIEPLRQSRVDLGPHQRRENVGVENDQRFGLLCEVDRRPFLSPILI